MITVVQFVPRRRDVFFQLWNELAEELKKPYYLEAERIKNQHRQDFPGNCLVCNGP